MTEPTLVSEDGKEYIRLDPNYPNLLRWFADALSTHSFDRGFLGSVISTLEIARWLQQTAPEELEKVLTELRATQHRRTYGDTIYVRYCDSYDSITKTCSHSKPFNQEAAEEWDADLSQPESGQT